MPTRSQNHWRVLPLTISLSLLISACVTGDRTKLEMLSRVAKQQTPLNTLLFLVTLFLLTPKAYAYGGMAYCSDDMCKHLYSSDAFSSTLMIILGVALVIFIGKKFF